MDWSNIIVGGMALIGTLAGSYFSHRKTTALVTYRLEELEKKQDKHNNVLERMALAEKDIKNIYHQIDEIKEDAK